LNSDVNQPLGDRASMHQVLLAVLQQKKVTDKLLKQNTGLLLLNSSISDSRSLMYKFCSSVATELLLLLRSNGVISIEGGIVYLGQSLAYHSEISHKC